MNPLEFLCLFGEYAIIVPAGVVCLLPCTRFMRFPPRATIVTSTLILVAMSFFAAALEMNLPSANRHAIFYPCLLLLAALYVFAIELPFSKLWYLYSSVAAAMSFGGILNHMIEAQLHPNGTSDMLSGGGLIAQWIFALLFLLMFALTLRRRLVWLFETFHSKTPWRIVWITNVAIAVCNLFMIPRYYSTFHVGRVFATAIVVVLALLTLYVFSFLIFHALARAFADKYEAEQKAFIYSVQLQQFASQQKYFKGTARLCHDFRHALRTINSLTSHGEYDALRKFVADYIEESHINVSQIFFCKNQALNALLNYYAALAEINSIDTNWSVTFDSISADDVDLCTMLGNLLENAINACSALPESKRYINLSADVDAHGLQLAVVNSMDPEAQRREKKKRRGIGLISIKTIVEKYDGVFRHYIKDEEFIVNIMLPERGRR